MTPGDPASRYKTRLLVKRPRISIKLPKLKRPNLKGATVKRATLKSPRAAKRAASEPQAAKAPAKQGAERASHKAAEAKIKPKWAQDKGGKPKQDPAVDLWFRFSTRVRAVGYGAREKGQQAGRLLAEGWERLADLVWLKRSHEGRIRIGAVAGVLLLYAVLKFIPVPGVPCSVSAVKECAPPDDAVALVPADALLYTHLTLDEDSTQFERQRRLRAARRPPHDPRGRGSLRTRHSLRRDGRHPGGHPPLGRPGSLGGAATGR